MMVPKAYLIPKGLAALTGCRALLCLLMATRCKLCHLKDIKADNAEVM